MVNTKSKEEPKRLSKGERTHNRRVKQALRKETPVVQPKKASTPKIPPIAS
jgi:hypothetical protein